MTSIIIPYAPSHKGNTELRYCLKSIERYLKNYGEVFVIGPDPGIEGVTHIPATDAPEYSRKERNVFNKLLLACDDPRVSDPFLVVHDDHYLLTEFDAGCFPNYCASEWKGQGLYMDAVNNTKSLYPDIVVNYDVHAPMLMRKDVIRQMSALNWDKKFGYCIKSIYARLTALIGDLTTDLKIIDPALTPEQIREQLRGRKWFSVGDHVFRMEGMKEVMDELYAMKETV